MSAPHIGLIQVLFSRTSLRPPVHNRSMAVIGISPTHSSTKHVGKNQYEHLCNAKCSASKALLAMVVLNRVSCPSISLDGADCVVARKPPAQERNEGAERDRKTER